MRKTSVVVPIVALLALALLLWWKRPATEVPLQVAPLAMPPPPALVETPAEPVEVPDAPQVPLATEAAAPRHAVAQPAEPASSARLVLHGRTVDERDLPLAGVQVRLHGYKFWAEGVDVPRFPGKYDLRGFEVATDEHGDFRFDVPVPTVEQTWLTIRPDPFHDLADVYFGGTRRGARPPLPLVGSDLGVFRLATTGAIRGRVTDADGRGISECEMGIGNDTWSTLGRDGTSDASGAYVIAHVAPATLGVKAKREGYLSKFQKPVEVRAGVFTDGVDFGLETSPTLRGIVVDDAGAPVQGAKLWGWPSNSGSGAGATSLADGTFTIHLPQDEPYTLEATLAGFAPYRVNDRTTHYPPGTSDLRVELKRVPTCPMLVLNAANDQPIAKFGFQVLRDNSLHAERQVHTESAPAKLGYFPNGLAQVEARLGTDVIVVSAEGFSQQIVDLEPGVPAGGRIVVRMEGAGSVVGRILEAGAPVARLPLRLDRGALVPGMDSVEIRFRPDASPGEEQVKTLRPTFAFRRTSQQTTASDDQGVFRFESVEPGSYLLFVAEAGERSINLAPITVGSSPVDLGDVVLAPGAAILGQVLAPPGRARSGLKVWLDDRRSGTPQVTDVDGRFRFAGLPAGVHELLLDEVPGAILDPPSMQVELSQGEQRELVYDVSTAGSCQVCLTLLVGSQPAANSDVEVAVPVSGAAAEGVPWLDENGRRAKRYRLGRTDAAGRVCGSLPAGGVGSVSLQLEPRSPLVEHPTAELALTLDARLDQSVSFELGKLVVSLPESAVPTESAVVHAYLLRGSDRRRVQSHHAMFDPRSPVRSWTFEHVLAGEFELEVELEPAHRRSTERRVLFRAAQPATIRAGETTEVQLR